MSTHGLTGYKIRRCKCSVCRAANRAYVKQRARKIGYGTWNPLVSAEPARAHVKQLMTDGLGYKRIAALASVSVSTVSSLLYGKPGRKPTGRLRPEVAAKLLQVRANLDNAAAARPVDATGTRRRLQALVAVGWPQTQLANRLGMTPTNFGRMLAVHDEVIARTARAVIALYDELWDQEPTTSKSSRARALNYAAARNWLPPMAWDDDTIDLPTPPKPSAHNAKLEPVTPAELQVLRGYHREYERLRANDFPIPAYIREQDAQYRAEMRRQRRTQKRAEQQMAGAA